MKLLIGAFSVWILFTFGKNLYLSICTVFRNAIMLITADDNDHVYI